MKYPAFLALLALSGCVLAPNQAERMSVVDLCSGVIIWGPQSAAVAQREIERRGINCKDHEAAVAARVGAASTGRAPAPNRVTTCNTYSIGARVQTQCY